MALEEPLHFVHATVEDNGGSTGRDAVEDGTELFLKFEGEGSLELDLLLPDGDGSVEKLIYGVATGLVILRNDTLAGGECGAQLIVTFGAFTLVLDVVVLLASAAGGGKRAVIAQVAPFGGFAAIGLGTPVRLADEEQRVEGS